MSVELSAASGTAATAGASPAGAAAPSNPATAGLGQDAFLQLLVSELKNQDPTNPESGSAFIAELAQFSSLQQLTGINQSITSLVQLLSSAVGAAAAASPTSASTQNITST